MNAFDRRELSVYLTLSVLAAVMAFTLIGCESESTAPRTGAISFAVTDAPADDVSRVQLTINAMSLKPADGSVVMLTLAEPVVVENLLDLQGGNAIAVLGRTQVPAGRYNWVRLHVTPGGHDSFVIDDAGGMHDLLIPGQQSGNPHSRYVQLVSGFVVPAGGAADFTIDVDLRRALVQPSSSDDYFLRPALRIVDNALYGSIAGSVDTLLISGPSCTADVATGEGNAVYLYDGPAAATGDIYIDEMGAPLSSDNPVAVAPVKQDSGGVWRYRFGYVSPGDYTVAFTCQARGDDPSTDDAVLMQSASSVTVTTGSTATMNLAALP